MKKLALICIVLPLAQLLQAQFYYNDLIQQQQHLNRHQQYREQKVLRIVATSRASDDMQDVTPLTVEQQYNNSYSQLKTQTSAVSGRSSIANYYNGQGQLYKTVDSSDNAVTTYEYQYQGNNLANITSSSVPLGEKTRTVEVHQWSYDSLGKPMQMLRIRNGSDSSLIRLSYDNSGNVSEEQVFKNGVAGEKVFYYYDEQHRITDIVRYQDKLGKLMPDFTFDFNPQGQLSQMMVVQNGGTNYQTWRYSYNNRGLLTAEACYDRQKKLVGKVEYTYEFKR